MERLSDRLVRIRKTNGMSAHAVASKMGIPASTYRAWEAGRAIQGHEAFIELSRALSVSLVELITGMKPGEAPLLVIEKLKRLENEIRAVQDDLLLLA